MFENCTVLFIKLQCYRSFPFQLKGRGRNDGSHFLKRGVITSYYEYTVQLILCCYGAYFGDKNA